MRKLKLHLKLHCSVWALLALSATTALGLPAPSSDPGAVKVLANFNGVKGAYPWDKLTQATDGNFYGTTQNGGTSTACQDGCGTVFKVTPEGKLTRLKSFNGKNGSDLYAGLVQGPNGNLYGVTTTGGHDNLCPGSTVPGCGTVFEITTGGTLTVLHRFSFTDGADPTARLIVGQDGNFYGTTDEGGQGGAGTIFRMTPTGTLTTLWNFDYWSYGISPEGALVQAPNGDLLGMAWGGDDNDDGVVYRLAPKGKYTVLHYFNGADGSVPYAGLIIGTDGNFYGTTMEGGAYPPYGTVFKMTPAGKLTTLHSFNETDGDILSAPVMQGADGNIYGTTDYGGTGNYGTVFEMTPKGKLQTLLSFDSTNGAYIYAGLIQGTDGRLYGNAFGGGTSKACSFGCGTVFSLPAGKH